MNLKMDDFKKGGGFPTSLFFAKGGVNPLSPRLKGRGFPDYSRERRLSKRMMV